jgi:hypothetical protein
MAAPVGETEVAQEGVEPLALRLLARERQREQQVPRR